MFPSVTPAPTGTPVPQFFEGEFNLKKALEVLYLRDGVWFTDSDELKASVIIKGREYTATIDAVLVAPFTEDGAEKYVVLAETALPFDCHPCSAEIGGGVFVRAGDLWTLEARADYLGSLGSFGHAPKGELIQIGPGKYGFAFRLSYVSTGLGTSGLVVYASVDKDLEEILSIQTGLASVIEPKWGYASTIEFVPGNNPRYYDVWVKTSGTKMDDGQLVSVEETRVYVFDNSKYVLHP